MPEDAVISVWDVDSIYKIPQMLHDQGLDDIICEELKLAPKPADLSACGRSSSTKLEHPKHEVTIGMVGKYVDLTESYKSLIEALRHAAIHTSHEGQHRVHRFRADRSRRHRERSSISTPCSCRAASARAARKARSQAIRYARETKMPYLGICLGMQLAVIEFARDVAGLARREQHRVRPDTPHPVVALITEWYDRDGPRREARRRIRSRRHDAPRRAEVPDQARHAWPRASTARDVNERHRHRYEVNNRYRAAARSRRALSSALVPPSEDSAGNDGTAARMHPWFVGVQFHPEFTSTPRDGPSAVHGVRRSARSQRSAGSAKATPRPRGAQA